ncbi:MAG: glutamine--fructose-6-phosphate transaminase (isomerizing) [Candidatus Nealsonbacteria bacterium]
MCGIIGYIGKRKAMPILLEGLHRESYRGYDSSGLVLFGEKEAICIKAVGKLENLENKLNGLNPESYIGLGHVRWATTGKVTEENTHPHYDCNKNIWVVHNGIIENYKPLKERLKKEGHKFYSETDTEVISHLIEKFFDGNLEEAVRKTLPLIKGTYGLMVMAKEDPEKLVIARLSSPLLIGLGEDEYIVASDPSAILAHTKKVIYLEDGEIAVITKDNLEITSLTGKQKTPTPETIDWSLEDAQKGGYPHFMLKEIMEQPESIRNSMRGRVLEEEGEAKLGGLSLIKSKLKDIERIIIVACGTARYAGLIGEYMLEEYAGIPVEVDSGSEFRYRKNPIDKKTAVVFISQSGETADTLAGLREMKNRDILTIGITNVVGSSQSRETDAGIYNHAGPEIGVASTKAYTSQLVVLALLTLFLGRQRNLSLVMGQRIAKELLRLPELVESILKDEDKIKEIAKKYKDFDHFLYLGRKYNFPTALEGSLKLKEISYLHAEGYAAGEMKHGPIAMISPEHPSLVLCPTDSVYNKVVSSIEQITCRNGKVIAIATEGNEDMKKLVDDVIYIPKTLEMLTPILSIIPLQLLAYHIGVLRGNNVDKPRNLAKSVTVE